MRTITSPIYGEITALVPVSAGGSSAKAVVAADANLGLLSFNAVGAAGGVAGLDASGDVLSTSLASSTTDAVHVDGNAFAAASAQSTYQITNFDSGKTYTVTPQSGATAVLGANGLITFTAPAALGASGFTVTTAVIVTVFVVTVIAAKPDAPVILSPVNAATNQLGTVAVSSSAFAMYLGAGADTHASTDWQLATDAGFTTVVQSSTADAVNKTSWVVSGLSVSTTYYVRARYNGVATGAGSWGTGNSFTTKATLWPVAQQAKLLAGDPAANDAFGKSIALSSDGETCAVGAYSKTGAAGTNQGAVYIFTRSGVTWTQQAKLLAGDPAANDFFGTSVAISSDGNTCVVGSYLKTGSAGANQGAAYIFTRSGVAWTQQAKLLASDPNINDYFGYSIAISDDGNTCAVGAYNKTGATGAFQGFAYVFIREVVWWGITWTQQAKLLASDPAASDYFGYSIALSSDGNTCVVGSYLKTGSAGANQGAAYIFTRSGVTWVQQAKLVASDPASYDYFGCSVAVSGDGNACAVGASLKTGSAGGQQGAAYIFTRSGVTWTQQAKLLAGDPAAIDRFGNFVSLSGDGVTCAVGAFGKTSYQGAAYIFTRSGVTWVQQAKLVAGDPAASDYFGHCVALSNDGNTCVVGSYPKTGTGGSYQGAAYVFV